MLRVPRSALALIFVLALLVRLGFLLADSHPYANAGLAASSGEIARQIDNHGRWFTSNLTALDQLVARQRSERRLVDPASLDFRRADAHPRLQPDALQPIGESVVLAGVWKLTGSERWVWWQLLTIALDSTMVLVVYAIGRRLFERSRPALIGAGLYAVFPPISWLATIPHLDIWAVDFTLVAVALLLRAGSREPGVHSIRWLIAAGVAIGLGSYFRPGVLLIAPLVGLAALSRRHWVAALRVALIPTLVAGVLIVPWTVRNANAFHRFIPLRIGVGQNLWEGLGELHNGFGAVLDDVATERQVHATHPRLVYGSPAYDDLLRSWATRAIKAHPGFFARLVAWRGLQSTLLLHDPEWAGSVPAPAQVKEGVISYAIQRPLDVLALALEPLLFVCAVATALITRRRFAREHLLLLAVILATLLPYLFLHLEPRYALPASFAYLLWAGLGVDLALRRLRRRTASATPAVAGSSLLSVGGSDSVAGTQSR